MTEPQLPAPDGDDPIHVRMNLAISQAAGLEVMLLSPRPMAMNIKPLIQQLRKALLPLVDEAKAAANEVDNDDYMELKSWYDKVHIWDIALNPDQPSSQTDAASQSGY